MNAGNSPSRSSPSNRGRGGAKVADRYGSADDPVFICDFSPPRGGAPALMEGARVLDADFLSVACNPARSVRALSPIAAHWIRDNVGAEVIFSVATRDMNVLGIQSLLLGAQMLGLDNVLVMRGDAFDDGQRAAVTDVNDLPPTRLIESISSMNEGVDYRGLRLRGPTGFCIGATVDLARPVWRETGLTCRKAEAGAHYFVCQPTFDTGLASRFLSAYEERHGAPLHQPLFHGVQVMTGESIRFGDVDQWVVDDLAKGRAGTDIALQTLDELRAGGFHSFYLVPPILPGGRRDYEAAQAVIDAHRSSGTGRR